jgi:hypothetical protein
MQMKTVSCALRVAIVAHCRPDSDSAAEAAHSQPEY